MTKPLPQKLNAKIEVWSDNIELLTKACAGGFTPEKTESGVVTLWRQFPDGYLRAPCALDAHAHFATLMESHDGRP